MKQILFVACALLSGCALAAGVDMGELVREAKPAILQLYPLDSRGASIEQLSNAILGKLIARGELSLAQRFLQEQKHHSDLEQQALDAGRFDVCDDLASEELRWVPEIYDKLH